MANTKAAPRRRAKKVVVELHHPNVVITVAVVAAMTTVVLSAWFNVEGMCPSGTTAKGVVVGVLLPFWVLVGTYVGHSMDWVRVGRVPWLAWMGYAVAGAALIVSLPHIAHGFESLGLSPWEAWPLAFICDGLQVVMKLTIIQIVEERRRQAQS